MQKERPGWQLNRAKSLKKPHQETAGETRRPLPRAFRSCGSRDQGPPRIRAPLVRRSARQANSAGDISGIPHHFHPVFITHPDTGRKTLFVDRLMTTRIEGVDAAESAAMLDELYEIGERREFIFEHIWKLGDFVMWDNRKRDHKAHQF
jgi:alpha-ketoglutarate-dependent taurine dioxygenase